MTPPSDAGDSHHPGVADSAANSVADHDSSAPAAVVEPVPGAAATVFGVELPRAERFADLLTGAAVQRGLLGPREAARVWSRHVLNCAVVAELFADGVQVVDVGSGAGLPGLALAIARPDLRVVLLEPLQRRAEFLSEAVGVLDLTGRVQVLRGRAEDPATVREVGGADWVTARAVAPLDRLMRWCLPLARPGGRLALIKGEGAADEVRRHGAALRRAGVRRTEVISCGREVFGSAVPATTVVMVEKAESKGSR